MVSDCFCLIADDEKKVLECCPIEGTDSDYIIKLFVKNEDGDIYTKDQWTLLDAEDVTSFIKSNWDLSKVNPLELAKE